MAEYSRSMPIREDEPVSSEEKSKFVSDSSETIKFSQNVIGLEIANHSSTETIFLKIDGSAASPNDGIPIYPKGYYSADKKILKDVGISIISTAPVTDVRIIGHFDLEVEEK
jgi:hypothetical protein